MRLYRPICLLISLLLAQAAFSQCPLSTSLTKQQRELEDRSVLLTVKLTKGGVVRDATALRGPEALRAPAIKAAKARTYKHRVVYSFPDRHEMMVEVTFPQNANGMPEVHQALPAGVPGCVYVQPMQIITIPPSPLPPLLSDFLGQQSAIPTLIPETKK
jgi:hypothetical protein